MYYIGEVSGIKDLKDALQAEGRVLNILEPNELKQRFGFIMKGLQFAEKVHDRSIEPDFMNTIAKHLESRGGKGV